MGMTFTQQRIAQLSRYIDYLDDEVLSEYKYNRKHDVGKITTTNNWTTRGIYFDGLNYYISDTTIKEIYDELKYNESYIKEKYDINNITNIYFSTDKHFVNYVDFTAILYKNINGITNIEKVNMGYELTNKPKDIKKTINCFLNEVEKAIKRKGWNVK